MRGISAISEGLNAMVEGLPDAKLSTVVQAALDVIARDFAEDVDIQTAINGYRVNPRQSSQLAGEYDDLSRTCDAKYIYLEDNGRKAESQLMFRKMCVLNGLCALRAAPQITREVLDDVIYNIGFGAASTDSFADAMIVHLASLI